MRLMVFFDLPVMTKQDRRIYTRFRKFLLRDGYDMIQFSVYARICNGPEAVEKHLARLTPALPPAGSVRSMQVTEKQFTGIKLLVGKKKEKEKTKFADQLSLF
jgi:CRISPR-associated protein Cas2